MGSKTDSNTPSPSGNFSYPPPGSSLVFNYVDSLVTSWLTFDPNATGCLLSIWYWPWVDHSLPKIGMSKARSHFCVSLEVDLELSIYEDDDKLLIGCSHHLIGYNQTAAANGTALVPLNLLSHSFPAVLNFDYNASDGRHRRVSSPTFQVDYSPQSRAVTWSQGMLADPTPSRSAVLQTSISASLLTSNASTASAASSTSSVSEPLSTSSPHLENEAIASMASAVPSSPSVSKSSTTSNSRLGTGAIAGVVVGIVVCVGLAASLVFYRRRKPNKIQAEVEIPPSADFQSPIPVNSIGEKDATPLHPPELSGDSQLVEMATGYHGETNASMGRA